MKYLIFFTLVSLLTCCNLFKKTNGGKCTTSGVVRDFTGLDGCGLLIELENGDKLNPMKVKDNFVLKDGQKIRFSYREVPDAMSICMAERAIVEITCIEEMKGDAACVDTENPFAVPWMDKAVDRHNPTRIVKYRMKKEWAYLFNALPVSYLYDCRGSLLCETNGSNQDECHVKYLNHFGKGKIIWEGEGVWD